MKDRIRRKAENPVMETDGPLTIFAPRDKNRIYDLKIWRTDREPINVESIDRGLLLSGWVEKA